MADDKGWGHADIQLLVRSELIGDKLTGSVGDWLQTLDEEAGDAWDKLHDSTHLYAEAKCGGDIVYKLLAVLACQTAYDDAYDDTKEERLAEETELLLHSLRVDMHLVYAGDIVKTLVYDNSERHETLTEWLGDGDAFHAWIELLETLGGKVGKDKRDDIADNGGEESPPY